MAPRGIKLTKAIDIASDIIDNRSYLKECDFLGMYQIYLASSLGLQTKKRMAPTTRKNFENKYLKSVSISETLTESIS